MGCGWVHGPADPILRSESDLANWFGTVEADASMTEPGGSPCDRSQLGDLDWSAQSVAIVSVSGSSNVERMAVRGDALVVHTKGIAQCGGQEIPGWSGVVLVVVPSTVAEISSKFRRAPRCPPGPPQP